MRLRAALAVHGEAIEADLARYYGVALSDLAVGRLTWRRLGVLIRQLPVDSATAQASLGPSAAWSATDHLLAGILDAERAALWQRSGGRGHKPRPIERPGTKAKPHRIGSTTRSPHEVKAYLARFRPAPPQRTTHGG